MWRTLLALSMVAAHPGAPVAPGWSAPAAARTHPVDGPDVDVRVQIQESVVRFQITMNLAYVDEIVDAPREDEFAIRPSEHAAIRKTLFGFYGRSNKVTVDGEAVGPVDREFEVDPGDPDMLPLFPRSGEKALVAVRMLLDYPCKRPPARVSMTWGEFPINRVLEAPGSSPRIEVKAHLIAKGIDKIVPLTAAEPEYTWHDTGESVESRFLAVPAPPQPKTWRFSAVTAGLGAVVGLWILGLLGTAFTAAGRRRLAPRAARLALVAVLLLPVGWFARDVAATEITDPFDTTPALPTAVEAAAIFAPLHRNIYRAFDYVEESQIYDALARSVQGDMLDALYNQVYRSLIMHEEGGAVSRVEAVRPLDTEVESIGLLPQPGDRPGFQVPGFQVRAKWQVEGVVRHWNHAHYRTNEYEARYTVVQAEQGWRIASHKVLDHKRVDEGDDAPKAK